MSQSHRIPSLDGIRAFAVATVILCHIQQRFTVINFPALAPDGVEVFFVLSGFLITTLLLREQERTGSISLAGFFGRRAARILPPLFVYLAVAAVVCKVAGKAVPWSSILGAGLFVGGIFPRVSSFLTEHMWSLAVEEQFYLLWPFLLIWALRRGGKRLAAWASLGLILASPVLRMAMFAVHSPILAHKQGSVLPGRMDSLFAGCLAAICLGMPRFERAYARASKMWWLAPVFFCILAPVLRVAVGNAYTFTFGYTLESLLIAFFIVWVARNPASFVGRVLNFPPIALLGVASYSLYLYQSAMIHGWRGAWWTRSPLTDLVAVLLAGFGSYYLVERPVVWLRLRARSTRERRHEAASHTEPLQVGELPVPAPINAD
ncbi:acyltransferase [Acidipila sp. EB88]|uniref:acyltransferase family protein n=1 Tax=Acidipila sp. EB88 TaxID=2305226 RepID=UPI0013154C90|nr:acyltransferase [Acidipila sp. EB88]